MRIYLLLIFLVLATFSFSSGSHAEVLNKSAGGFVIEIEAQTDQSIEDVYQQFLKINEWWDGDHSWFGSATNFYIEPRVGGCFCEVDGDKLAPIVDSVQSSQVTRLVNKLENPPN